MHDPSTMLAVLQHGDSFFPSGAVSFSWGMETLCAENIIADSRDVEEFIRSQLTGRWADFDRNVVLAAHRLAENLDSVRELDAIVESQTLAEELRTGSRRSGSALLGVHENLATPGSGEFRESVRSGDAYAHLSVMQGFLWSRLGIGETEALAISGHGLCVALLGASLRLGVIGHSDSQRILTGLRNVIDKAIAKDVLPPEKLQAYTPLTEIAAMRHETAETRLFAN